LADSSPSSKVEVFKAGLDGALSNLAKGTGHLVLEGVPKAGELELEDL